MRKQTLLQSSVSTLVAAIQLQCHPVGGVFLIGRPGLQRAVALTPDIIVTNQRSGGCDPSVPGLGHPSDILQAEWPFDGVGCTRPRARIIGGYDCKKYESMGADGSRCLNVLL